MKNKKILISLLIIFTTGCNDSASFSNKESVCNHNIVIDKEIPATCTKAGLTEGSHCSICNEVFVSQKVVKPLEHDVEIDVAIDGTCIEKGLTEGKHCKECHEILVAQEETSYGEHIKDKIASIPLSNKAFEYTQVGEFKCKYCHNDFYSTLTPSDINMPIVNIDGSMNGISKDEKKKVKITYDDGNNQFTYDSTIKLQGATSINFPKKNYNIQFFKDDTYNKKQKVELDSSWGKQSKYTLKANYVDFSQSRNVVSAKIYGDIVHSKDIDDEYNKLINGGAIDGFPVLVYINGECNGLYTMNTPKDNWLFNMDGNETTRQALVMANNWSDTCRLKEPMAITIDNGWELEYSSTEDINNDWISTSFNEMISFINNNGKNFKDGIGKYVNIYRVIDAMLYIWFISAYDNVSKNILWSTYDGVKWQPNVYDLDGTWGLRWDGVVAYGTEYSNMSTGNLLWEKIYANYQKEIADEWFELRKGPLSYSNIKKRFTEFNDSIDSTLYEFDKTKWEDVPSPNNNNLKQILEWAYKKGNNQDKYFKEML